MAFGCGFGLDGGFVDACILPPPPPPPDCGGGYGSDTYATVEYAGSNDCVTGGIPAAATPRTNLENVCIQTCGSTPI